MDNKEQILNDLKALQADIHATALDKGWWDDRNNLISLAKSHHPSTAKYAKSAVVGSALALIHSEVSEALEADRNGDKPDDKIPEYTGMEAELADVMIRIYDLAEAFGLRVNEAMIEKIQMNKSRSHKHGKSY